MIPEPTYSLQNLRVWLRGLIVSYNFSRLQISPVSFSLALMHQFVRVYHQDFRLASLVASGSLRRQGGAVVDALFKSIMLKINRSCEKRPHSSQFFGNELACELAFTLGRGRAMKEVLHLFGVSEKVIPKVDLQISYLPQSHISPTHPFNLPTHPRGGCKKM